MTTVAIIGASGYIGRHLVAELCRRSGFQVRVMVRDSSRYQLQPEWNVEVIEGEIFDEGALKHLLAGCNVLVNLAYFRNGGEASNVEMVDRLISGCMGANVARFVHCSTAAVIGRVEKDVTNEETRCHPVTQYGITKLKLEEMVRQANGVKLDTVILRPTAVFGEDGANLKKLVGELIGMHRWKGFLKSCLFGKRRMNLVHIDNVVAAILFVIKYPESFGGGVFNISEDDAPSNNYADVQASLMYELGIRPCRFAPVHLPLSILAMLLVLKGRNNVNPRCIYAPDKLLKLGFTRVSGFEEALARYAKWCLAQYLKAGKP